MNLGSEPEFCLTIGVRNVDMNAWLFPGEEKKTELTIANNCGCHARTLHRGLCRVISPVSLIRLFLGSGCRKRRMSAKYTACRAANVVGAWLAH